ncbi:hypothetical protein [Oceanobacillus senegalensis]|nr:hypothetical protein [Oceanobacillus senegalensis]
MEKNLDTYSQIDEVNVLDNELIIIFLACFSAMIGGLVALKARKRNNK